MLLRRRKKRIPRLSFSKTRNIGWYVSYRDAATRVPRKYRFGMMPREEAQVAYHEWVADHLKGKSHAAITKEKPGRRKVDFRIVPDAVSLTAATGSSAEAPVTVVPGSLLHVASGLLKHEEARVREYGEAKRQGSIHPDVLGRTKQFITDFLEYLNARHGRGAVGHMMLADLSMNEVEEYNRAIVNAGYAHNGVVKRLQVVKNLIDRAGRPEHGGQVLGWNWDSRDVLHGVATKRRVLPTAEDLRGILGASGVRETAMIWMGIGLGFGPNDLALVRVGQIDEKSYDLRRSKTGVERFGETPLMVWKAIQAYLKETTSRGIGTLLFVTRKGMPVVHGTGNSVQLWWYKLRRELGITGESLGGFYTLRHLGATEFGSRPGCSISAMKRWLGHGASSQMADVYMRPVTPETREVVELVREALATGEIAKAKTT